MTNNPLPEETFHRARIIADLALRLMTIDGTWTFESAYNEVRDAIASGSTPPDVNAGDAATVVDNTDPAPYPVYRIATRD